MENEQKKRDGGLRLLTILLYQVSSWTSFSFCSPLPHMLKSLKSPFPHHRALNSQKHPGIQLYPEKVAEYLSGMLVFVTAFINTVICHYVSVTLMILIKCCVQLLWIFKSVSKQISVQLFSLFHWRNCTLHLFLSPALSSLYDNIQLILLLLSSSPSSSDSLFVCACSASLLIQASSSPGNTPTWRWTSPKIATPTSSPTTTPVSSWLPSRVRLAGAHTLLHPQHLTVHLERVGFKLQILYLRDVSRLDRRSPNKTVQNRIQSKQ